MLPYTGHGSPRGLPVVFLHGFLGSKEDWTEVQKLISGEFLSIAFDLPGHGAAHDGADGTLSEMADEVVLSLKTLGIHRAVFCGYSLGGRITMQILKMHRKICAGLIIESASSEIAAGEIEDRIVKDSAWSDMILTKGLDVFLDAWYSQPVFADLKSSYKEYDAMIARRKKNNVQQVSKIIKESSPAKSGDFTEVLAAVIRPMLYLAGANDLSYIQKAQALKKVCGHMKLEIIGGAGHNCHLQQSAIFAQHVNKFLSEIPNVNS